MSKLLNISEDLKLPLDFTTQTQAILAKRGVGKSYTASVEAEELLKHRQQIVVIDPTGAWHGLRSSADGKSEGYPIVIFGGEHADVPLEEHAGEAISRAIVEQRFSAIIDLSLFRKGQMMRFMVDFAETLYRLNREAMHLFVDEADAVAPQARNYGGEENRLLGAMEDIVRRGRKRGIGCTLITQRPAVLNKNVLTQCEILVALRLVHPKDINAIEEWVNVHADPSQAKEMIESLPSLPIGTAWFWAPGWGDIFTKARIRKRETFDSGATPKAGEKQATAKVLAAIDIEQLGTAIKSSVELAKANDPKALKRRILELEQKLAQRPQERMAKEKIVEVPVLKNGQLSRTEKIADRVQVLVDKLVAETSEIRRLITPAATAKPMLTRSIDRPVVARAQPPRQVHPPKIDTPQGDGVISKRQQRMLNAAVALFQLGVEVTRESVCGWIGVHPRGGSVGEELKALSDAGLIVVNSGAITITAEGIASAEPMDAALAIERAKSALTNRQKTIFELVTAAYPESTTRDAVAEAMQIHPRGGSLGEDIGRLAGRGLISSSKGVLKAKDFLFASA